MTKRVPVYVDLDTATSTVSVTADAGSAGQSLGITTASVAIRLRPLNQPIQYKVGSGAWSPIVQDQLARDIEVDLSTTTVLLRKADGGSASIPVAVEVDSIATSQAFPAIPASRLSTAEVTSNKALVSGAWNIGTALPVLLPSSGSVAANGALTLTTAVPLSGGYSWGCFMYLPAGAAYSGSVAGLYYVEMSSNSAGTIYDNRYTSGVPAIPTTKTPIVAAGPGAYTQTTAQISLVTVTLAGGTLGVNGKLICAPTFVFPSNANSKTCAIYLNGSVVYGKTRTTATQEMPLVDIRNRGVLTRQFSGWAANALPGTSNSSGVVNTAIDTSASFEVTYRGQLAVATDYIILESSSTDVYPFG